MSKETIPAVPDFDAEGLKSLVSQLKQDDPELLKQFRLLVAQQVIGNVIEQVVTIPDQAFDALIEFAEKRTKEGKVTAETVLKSTLALKELKEKLEGFATPEHMQAVVNQVGEDKVREILGEERAKEFLDGIKTPTA